MFCGSECFICYIGHVITRVNVSLIIRPKKVDVFDLLYNGVVYAQLYFRRRFACFVSEKYVLRFLAFRDIFSSFCAIFLLADSSLHLFLAGVLIDCCS